MAIFTDTIMVKDKPYDRAVAVTITGPEAKVSKYKAGSAEVEALGIQAWKSVNKTIQLGGITVKVKAFGR